MYTACCLHATLEAVFNLLIPLLSDAIAYYLEDERQSVEGIESLERFRKDTVPCLEGD